MQDGVGNDSIADDSWIPLCLRFLAKRCVFQEAEQCGNQNKKELELLFIRTLSPMQCKFEICLPKAATRIRRVVIVFAAMFHPCRTVVA
jgi:hypothetical protein